MVRTCGTCGRSWGRAARFCGTCGDLLVVGDTLGRTERTRGPRRLPWVRPLIAVAMAGGLLAVAAATRVDSEPDRLPGADAAIDLPDAEDVPPVPRAQRPRPRPDPPEIACTRDGEPVDCVTWTRALLPAPSPDGSDSGWVHAAGDVLIATMPEAIEGVDAITGTRLWRREARHTHILATGADAVLLEDQQGQLTYVEARSGEPRWQVRARATIWGDVIVDDVVVTGSDLAGEVIGRSTSTGEAVWRWSRTGGGAEGGNVHQLGDGLLLVSMNDGSVVVLDRRTGQEVSRVHERDTGWTVGVADEVVLMLDEPPEWGMFAPPMNVHGPVTLRGVSVLDGSLLWEQEHPLSLEQGPVMLGEVLLLPADDLLTALDVSSGTVLWEWRTEEVEQPAAAWQFPPATALSPPGDALVTFTGRGVRARDLRTGTPRWEWTAPPGTAPSLRPHWVTLGTSGAVLHHSSGITLLDLVSGEELVTITGAGEPISDDPLLLLDWPTGHVTRIDLDLASDGQ